MKRISFWTLNFILLLTFSTPSAEAQFEGFANLLNPEGSRLFPQLFVFPRHPGKPDPRWRSFNWEHVDGKARDVDYRLYYYDTEKWAAEFALPRIHDQVDTLIDLFDYSPSRRFDYLLFTSLAEFRQANIFFIQEGVEGITSTQEATMAIPYTGEPQKFDHISKHELVHQFQVQKVNDIALWDAQIALVLIPLWFIEGMAEYYSLEGMDREAKAYLRDLVLHPDEDRNHKIPELFEEHSRTFISIYKVGQAKIHFFESEFGKGTSQLILEESALAARDTGFLFSEVVSRVTETDVEELEEKWQNHIDENYRSKKDSFSQDMNAFEEIEAAGELLDLYRLSPSGSLLGIRSIDPMVGTTFIELIDLTDDERKLKISQSNRPGALSLYFMQFPNFALSDRLIAHSVQTTGGPELEIQQLSRDGKGKLHTGLKIQIKLHENDLIQVSSPAISEDQSTIAFVGLNHSGWENIYLLHSEDRFSSAKVEMLQLTNDPYSYRDLSWTETNDDPALLYASNQTSDAEYEIFTLDPKTGKQNRITHTKTNALSPSGRPDLFVYASESTGSPQIHLFSENKTQPITSVSSIIRQPELSEEWIYFLGYQSGKQRLYRTHREHLPPPEKSSLSVNLDNEDPPWQPQLISLDDLETKTYKAFSSSGVRIDNLSAFFSTGLVGGVAANVSDLMRNYQLQGSFFFLGELGLSNAQMFLSSRRGRSVWTTGGYHIVQRRVDQIFSKRDDRLRTYLHREFGALGAIQYPFTAFSYMDLVMRVGGVNRFDFTDLNLRDQWQDLNPGNELLLAPLIRLGYDEILYEPFTGPFSGYGAMIEFDTSYFPSRGTINERIRLDASYYIQVYQRMVLGLRGLVGGSFGDQFGNTFAISSEDILRAYPFGDPRLFGTYMGALKAEARLPFGDLFNFPYLAFVVAYDYGTVFNDFENLPTNVSTSYTLGLNMNLPPLGINFLFSFPGQTAPGPEIQTPVFHFLLRYLYL
jgi:hypothetical protein